MTSSSKPVLYYDRMPVEKLAAEDALLLEAMKNWKIGRIDSKNHIHFCGMIRSSNGRIAMFLPRKLDHHIEAAALAMASLGRYGRENLNRPFDNDGEEGNPGLLAVCMKLAQDFKYNGLVNERRRIHTRNTGKPDWKRTLTKGRAFPDANANAVFIDIATTRTVNSNNTLLASIQSAVIKEIISLHGWWLEGMASRKVDLRTVNPPHQPRHLWVGLLKTILPRLYYAREISLANWLLHYLENTRNSSTGNFVFGVEDFHTVWEIMLRRILTNSEEGWNTKLPKGVYLTADHNNAVAVERNMLTDIILRTGDEYIVVDAKYYDATTASSLPGWPDIAKQLFYEMSLRSVLGPDPKISNCFVFPASSTERPHYSIIQMQDRKSSEPLSSFGSVECLYIPIEKVLKLYRHGDKAPLKNLLSQ